LLKSTHRITPTCPERIFTKAVMILPLALVVNRNE
jgi:hypothetical protein